MRGFFGCWVGRWGRRTKGQTDGGGGDERGREVRAGRIKKGMTMAMAKGSRKRRTRSRDDDSDDDSEGGLENGGRKMSEISRGCGGGFNQTCFFPSPILSYYM